MLLVYSRMDAVYPTHPSYTIQWCLSCDGMHPELFRSSSVHANHSSQKKKLKPVSAASRCCGRSHHCNHQGFERLVSGLPSGVSFTTSTNSCPAATTTAPTGCYGAVDSPVFSFAAVAFRVVRHRVSQMEHLDIDQLFAMDEWCS